MRIGLVSERVDCDKRSVREIVGRRMKTETITIGDGLCDITAVSLPYTWHQLERLKMRKADAAVGRALDRLERLGIKKIVFSSRLKAYMPKDAGKFPDGRSVFHLFVPMCVRTLSQRCGIIPHRASLGIRETNSGRISEYLMNELCCDVKSITLYTEKIDQARDMCDRFFDETGLPALVAADSLQCERGEDIFIDVDNATVRIGRDVVVDGVELNFDLKEYSADSLDIAACIRDKETMKMVQAYKCGKNKLTL